MNSASFSQRSGTCGILWYYHISKTGGSTVKSVLQQSAKTHGNDFIDLWWHWDSQYDWRSQIPIIESAVLNAQSGTQTIVHHHNGGPMLISLVPQLIEWNRSLSSRGCRLWLATTVREPISHFISRMAFTGEKPANLKRVLQAPSYQTSHLLFNHARCPSGHNVCPVQRKRFSIRSEVAWQIEHGAALREEFGLAENDSYLSSAFAMLGLFDVVGITSELEAFVRRLQDILCLPHTPLKSRNVTPLKKKEVWKLDEFSIAQRGLINKSVEIDQALYEEAVKLKDREIFSFCSNDKTTPR